MPDILDVFYASEFHLPLCQQHSVAYLTLAYLTLSLNGSPPPDDDDDDKQGKNMSPYLIHKHR